MDLKKWCNLRCISVILIILMVKGVYSKSRTCVSGVSTPGYTEPHGDIYIEYGNPLDITCILNENFTKDGRNASSELGFEFENKTVSASMIRVIDANSIHLHIDKPERTAGKTFTCVQKKKNNTTTGVCMNIVVVAVKPQDVTDFDCISMNFDNLTCSWTAPNNYITTDYNLSYILKGRAARTQIRCPEIKITEEANVTRMSCFWNISTTPHYRQVHEEFYFTLQMQNRFGKNVMNKTFEHFEHVLSGPPENLTVINVTTSSVYLSWKVPLSMQTFPPGVHHRVLYQCEYGEKVWHHGGLIENASNKVYFNLTNLPYAHSLCDIRVSIRSAKALSDDMWSKNASVTVRTGSKVPDVPPETTVGSFEIVAYGNNLQIREGYLYWKQIEETQRNGPNFRYVVKVEGDDTIQPNEPPTLAYAKFNLSISKNYTFNIWSMNDEGLSPTKSVIHILEQRKRIDEPKSFVKVEYPDGQYELAWEPSDKPGEYVTNYTIFWCKNDRDRPYQCNGLLDWTIVPSNTTVFNKTVPTDGIYQFAIAANSEKGSSGMLWAACTVIHNRNLGKMKNVWVHKFTSTSIEVKWKLDCSDRIGSVEGFIIYYCPIIAPTRTECKGQQKNITYHGDTSLQGGNITNLTPYTTYMLTVAVITKHNTFSQQSDPLFLSTLESAPTPPLNLTCTRVTNSSISISWLPPEVTNGVLVSYNVKYNDQVKIIGPLTQNEPQTHITIENLLSFYTYNVTVLACTIACSNASETLTVKTEIGYPGTIQRPSVAFQNNSYISVAWNKPEFPSGRNEYYEVRMKQKHQHENQTTIYNVTSPEFNIDNCGDSGKYNTFYVSVRAVNIFEGEQLYGPWSEEFESYCRAPAYYYLYIIIPFGILFFFCVVGYGFNKMYKCCKIMRDVEVKLPPGLAPAVTEHTLVPWSTEKHKEERDPHSPADEELLLEKMNEGSRHLSGDSSGCSSGHESVVSSSLESNTHISSSSDSGTEQPANYCVLGVDTNGVNICMNNINLNKKTDTSSYVPFNSALTADTNKVAPPPYISCDASNLSSMPSPIPSPVPSPLPSPSPSPSPSPYVMAGDAVKTVNPGYVPYTTEPPVVAKTTGYVVAGIHCNGSVL